jgi:hypothetical protein
MTKGSETLVWLSFGIHDERKDCRRVTGIGGIFFKAILRRELRLRQVWLDHGPEGNRIERWGDRR